MVSISGGNKGLKVRNLVVENIHLEKGYHRGAVEVSDLDAFILGKEPRADLAHREPVQRRHEPDDMARPVLAIALGPVAPRGTRRAHLASGGEVVRSEADGLLRRLRAIVGEDE